MASSQPARVVVIGGGPGGATASTLIAQQGHQVQLFEREQFPRFHIGESLIPETYWVLKRLGMLPKMKGSHFVKKYSVQFVGASGRLSEPFYFVDHKPHESSQTWQVRRSEFDKLMLDNAREHGVDVHEGVRVLEVLFEGQRAVGVRIARRNGGERGSAGRRGGRRQRPKLDDHEPLRAARVGPRAEEGGACGPIGKGAYRDTGRDEGATIVIQTEGKKGWFWYIPLHDDIVSVGVVAGYEYLFKNRADKDHETIYFEEVAACAGRQQRVSTQARRVTEFFAAKEYSYRSRQAAGDGWVLVGDAFGFLDPLYSSGVLLALKSGQLAADAVVEGLAAGDTSAAQLGKWEADFVRGHGSHAAAGLRILRRLQLRPVRQAPSRVQRTSDRFVDRRSFQGQPGRSLRLDRRDEDRAGRSVRLRRQQSARGTAHVRASGVWPGFPAENLDRLRRHDRGQRGGVPADPPFWRADSGPRAGRGSQFNRRPRGATPRRTRPRGTRGSTVSRAAGFGGGHRPRAGIGLRSAVSRPAAGDRRSHRRDLVGAIAAGLGGSGRCRVSVSASLQAISGNDRASRRDPVHVCGRARFQHGAPFRPQTHGAGDFARQHHCAAAAGRPAGAVDLSAGFPAGGGFHALCAILGRGHVDHGVSGVGAAFSPIAISSARRWGSWP